MPELRKDPIVGRWVMVNVENPYLPEDFKIKPFHWKGEEGCPFCPGNEHLTPPETEVFSEAKRKPNEPGWKVRVVPNKYPALMIEGGAHRRGVGIYDISNGIGAHEVIIDSPYHYKDIPELSISEVEYIIKAYRSRSVDLRKDKRFKYILIFRNFGQDAGASLEHGHSQLIALPMVPKNVNEELKGANYYYEFRDRCIFCDMVAYEEDSSQQEVVAENEAFVSFCPLSSRFSFETWIVPKDHLTDFGKISDTQARHLSAILKETLARLKKVLGEHAYNYILHTSPVNSDEYPYYQWHIEIMPKLTKIAGFEWCSGFYATFTPPELAAKYLREVDVVNI